DEQAGMDGLVNPAGLLVGQLAAGHGVDAVDDSEMDGADSDQLGGDARNAVARVFRVSLVDERRRAFGRDTRAGVHRGAVADGGDGWFVFRSLLAVDGARGDAEAVLHRQSDARGAVLLELGQRDEDVAVFIGVVEIVAGVHHAAAGYHESRIFF